MQKAFIYKSSEHSLTLDHATFESIIKVALDKTISVCKRVLRDAKLELSDIQNVVLVGGSTRSYAVQNAVRDVFAQEPSVYRQPRRSCCYRCIDYSQSADWKHSRWRITA